MVPGVYAMAPVLSAWMANNSEPYYRRATSVALGFIATNSVSSTRICSRTVPNRELREQGGILSTWRFPTKEGPKFTKTTIMNLVLCVQISSRARPCPDLRSCSSCLLVVGPLGNAYYLSRKNKAKKRPGYREQMLAKYSDSKSPDGGVEAWMDLGDRHPDFVYAL